MSERICSIDGCGKFVNARGWCSMHYERWRVHGTTADPIRPDQRRCSIDGCGYPAIARGWCHKHYKRWQSHGDPFTDLSDRTVADRFWSKVDKNGPRPGDDTLAAGKGPCWLWTAFINDGGYGSFSIGAGVKTPAYRFSYEACVGPIPDGLVIDHLCRNPPCVNPEHLEPVPQGVNVRRGRAGAVARLLAAAITHCPQGHEYTPDNTRTYSGHRTCKACVRAAGVRYRARRKSR